ncbi:hypothetical protein [Micromonospora sp. NPDC050495]|uniref:hypothetical protein n=1 Tax=Micromonospora sp. NPDC050495 TaxID=3154936 RepID=UPI0033EE0410
MSVLLMRALAAGLVAAVAVAPGFAAASPTVTGAVRAMAEPLPGEPSDPVGGPGTDPTDSTPTADPTDTGPAPTTAPPTESAPPETTPPPPTEPAPATTAPGDPVPTTTAPRTTAPAPPPPPPGRPAPAGSPLGVHVTTGDVALPPAYWNADSTVTTLRVTVTNTGRVAERIGLGYTLPAGLADAGTPGCAPAGGGAYRCGEWTAAPGSRFSSRIRLRVTGTAWRSMPLSGTVRVTAGAAGVTGTAGDDEGFAVLFPPGPPVPGIALRADEVVFDITGAPTTLSVHLGNTGRVDAAGRVEVVLPDGVAVTDPPPGCAAAAADRTRCDLGRVAAGRGVDLRLPLSATAEAQHRAPLAGAVIGWLDPRSGRDRQVQMSFRIAAAAALSTPPVTSPTATGSQGVLAAAEQDAERERDGTARRTAVALIVVSGLLVVLALALATTSLRRRLSDPPGGDGGDGTPRSPGTR